MNITLPKTTLNDIVRQLSHNATKDEIRAGYLTGKIEGNQVIVEGVYIPKQHNSELWVLKIEEETFEIVRVVKKRGTDIVGFVKYNAGLSIFESPSTKATREDLYSLGKPNIALVFNSKGEHQIYK